MALGIRHAEPRFRSPLLHEGEWHRVDVKTFGMVTWRRNANKRKDCDEGHRAFVCTITEDTSHVDSCDCGATRSGVYGSWQ